ncbi:amylo-alpha-1,6-glucosidase [Kineococcus sp. SYSU DK018]|uniref:amylo-alpha-1,6-glucosidase n=1 Tax=Kineococcus sp. SYSU DK018 TaxID=3383139 RepID=UPI003D7D9481
MIGATGTPQDLTPASPGGDVTLVEGASFCVSDSTGDMRPDRPHGVFFQDTRVVSGWQLLLDDEPLQPLSVAVPEPFSAVFTTRAAPRPGQADATLVVQRRRMAADGLREDVVVRNHGTEPAGITLHLSVEADFADLFDVKEGRVARRAPVQRSGQGEDLVLGVARGSRRRGVRVHGQGATALPGALVWRVVVPAHGEWSTTVEVLPSTEDGEVGTSFPLDRPVEAAAPARRMRDRRRASPDVECEDPVLAQALQRSVLDLGALRIADPRRPGADVVAAGAPWFMALFGRDSLVTSWLALPFDPGLALGTLQTLADHQGRRVDPMSEEEPGRILHEVRLGVDADRALGGSSVYYGSVDATPLFVVVLDEVARWGAPLEEVRALLPAADRALEWVERYGDLDGDGFVEYRRKTDRGLLNQGWKDSSDSISFSDGRLAEGPIALVEVQAYVYAALTARAHLASLVGDEAGARGWEEKAERFRRAVDEAFWMPGRGCYALALDGRKEQVDALASNQGHCLWAGLPDPDKAAQVAQHLLSPAMFSGWGIRTLASTEARYNPVSYHNGSVWPHDNALAVAGLVRYGHVEAAQRVATGLLAASASTGGRLPELFCGFDRAESPVPVPYPTSCSPQAWAAATPIGLLTALLRLRVCAPHGRVESDPVLPASWGGVRVSGLAAGEERIDVDGDGLRPVREPAASAG